MLIKFKKPDPRAGMVADLDDAVAQRLIDSGSALKHSEREAVEPSEKKVTAPLETKVVAPAQTKAKK